MKKTLLFIFLPFLIQSCADVSYGENMIAKLESLSAENDSLKRMVAEINQKYVFDSISVRDIPAYRNKYELNSKIKGEILFIGYNLNDKSRVIKFDSVNNRNGHKLVNPDTLKNIKGGYQYEKILNSEFNILRFDLKTANNYGKPFDVVYHTAIRTKN